MLKSNKSILLAASGLSLAIYPTLGFAQTAPAQTASESDRPSPSGLQDIIVTAQKRSENVQDVPASLTAIGEEALQLRQIDSAADLQGQVPSLVIGVLFGSNQITLRGISSGLNTGSDDPSVASHIDGAYQPRSRSIDIAMVDLERVEVLAGPQGTLYGRNATGGAINYILRKSSDEFEGELTGRVGNYGRYGVTGSVSGPITDKVGIRVSGLYDDQSKGFTRVLNANAPKRRLDDYRAAGGRVVVDLKPTDTLSVSLQGIHLQTWGSTSYYPFGPSLNAAINAASQPQSYRAWATYSDVDAKLDSKYTQGVGTITWDVADDISLKSITAYQKYRQLMVIDSDGSATAPFRGPTTQRSDSRTITQEFNINANLFDNRLKSLLGFFYYNDNIDLTTDLTIFASGKNNFHTFQKARSYSVFTDHTFSITDDIRLIAGLRYNHDEKTATQSYFLQRTNGTVANTLPETTTKLTFNSWTPRFGFQADLNPHVMVYGTYSKGFKSGGFASNITAVNSYQPETIQGAEVGLKSDLADGRIRLNLAGYYYKYKNLQVTSAVLINNVSV
jgi:iron complex outermembrane receptor protein